MGTPDDLRLLRTGSSDPLHAGLGNAIIESAEDAIISKNLQGVIQTWNKAAERIFGYSPEEIIGQSITRLIPAERQGEEPEILARIRRGERIAHYETVRVRKDGTRIPISLTVSPIKDGRGNIIGASKIARDITERILAQNALKEADRRKDEFLAMLAHELRNPLTPIRTGLDLIQRNIGDPKRREWAFQVIDRQLVQLTRIIDDLFELARIVNGSIPLKRAETNLRTVVGGAIETSRPYINMRRHELRVELPLEEIRLYVDATRIVQALTNLLMNAAKYTEPGGTIFIGAIVKQGTVVIKVADSGRGIDAQLLPRLFNTFVQGDTDYARTGGGLGIGLAIVRRIVDLHGGTVRAASKGPKLGSEFYVSLPVNTAERPAEVAAAAPTDRAPERPRRVLVIDDNRDVTDMIGEYLRTAGHEIELHYDGNDVVEKIAAFRPDVVVMDLGLPGRDGFEIASEVRAHPEFKDLALIAVSGYGMPADVERTRTTGINFHMLKPVDMQLLLKLIEASAALPANNS